MVLLFHHRFPGFSSGFVGVDIFFVLSGFLITTLLLTELERSGRISLPDFWARRARRLLPALLMLLLVVAGVTWFQGTLTELASVRGDLLATTGYVANWHFINTSSYYLGGALLLALATRMIVGPLWLGHGGVLNDVLAWSPTSRRGGTRSCAASPKGIPIAPGSSA